MQEEQYNLLNQVGDDEEIPLQAPHLPNLPNLAKGGQNNVNFNCGQSSGRGNRDETATLMRASGRQFDPRTPFSGFRQPVTELREMFRNQLFGQDHPTFRSN